MQSFGYFHKVETVRLYLLPDCLQVQTGLQRFLKPDQDCLLTTTCAPALNQAAVPAQYQHLPGFDRYLCPCYGFHLASNLLSLMIARPRA
jgi:hypothetical protein